MNYQLVKTVAVPKFDPDGQPWLSESIIRVEARRAAGLREGDTKSILRINYSIDIDRFSSHAIVEIWQPLIEADKD